MIEQFFRKFSRMVGTGHNHKVVKSIKPTEEEALEMMALRGFEEAARKSVGVHQAKKKLFWAKVELRTGEVSRPLHWNDKKNVFEVIVCDHNAEGDDEADKQWES